MRTELCQRSKLLLAFALAAVVGCHSKKEEPGHEAAAKEESRVSRGTNDEIIVTIDTATQKTMGLEVAALLPAELSREVKGYGHVLDASALATQAAELKTAQAASQASQAELVRLKSLAAQSNASQRALEAAESTALRDQAQLEAVRLRMVASWGSAIAARPDLPAFAHSLANLEIALAQINLPAGDPLPAQPVSVRLATLGETNPIPAQLLGPAPLVDPQLQGRGFLLLVSPNSLRLTPGAAVSGFLDLPGEKLSGVALPRNAVVRFNGLAWVYVQSGEETFERRPVTLESPIEQAWFIHRGLKAQDKVVVAGAQQLLSEELKREEAE
jgi:multidrug efflux pump subunit AcrA (membrane-fusion protein)